MITRKCLSTTNITTAISTFINDMQATGLFTITDNRTDGAGNVKFNYTADEYINLEVTGSDYLSISIGGAGSAGTSVISAFNNYYLRYTIVKSGSSFGLAFNGSIDDADADRYTNAIELLLTTVNNNIVAITADNIMSNSQVHTLSPCPSYVDSTLNWVQLVPFGSPELGGASNEVYMIRFSPVDKSVITVSGQEYILGEDFAIKL